MERRTGFRILFLIVILLSAVIIVLFLRYFFTYEQRNILKRQIGSVTGMNLTVTIFGFDGKIIKRWTNIQKITTGRDLNDKADRNYTYFFTRKGKYVQIPDSVWYIAEEE